MSNIDKRPFRADGGDISTGRLKEIADNPYGDEEKCWLAKRVIALQAELEAKDSRIGELEVIATDYGIKFQKAQDALKHQSLLHKSQLEAAEKRISELTEKPIGWTDEQELRDVEKLGCGYLFNANPITPHADPRRVILLYAATAGKGE